MRTNFIRIKIIEFLEGIKKSGFKIPSDLMNYILRREVGTIVEIKSCFPMKYGVVFSNLYYFTFNEDWVEKIDLIFVDMRLLKRDD